MFDLFKKFVKENGHGWVFSTYPNKKLVYWVSTQRYFYQKMKLSDNRITLLEAAGFIWDTKKGDMK